MSERLIVQRALTREFLTMDLQAETAPRWELSGVGSLILTIEPDLGTGIAGDGLPLLGKWRSLVYLEENDVITWGGVVISPQYDDQTKSVECASMATYLYGLPYMKMYKKVQIDPADIVRHLWAHAQSYPDGDLGMQVLGSTPVRRGTEEKKVEFDTKAGEHVDFDAGPYKLEWPDAPDMGREMDSLASETPFDWVEQHRWNADRTEIIHEIQIGYPRVGRHRDRLSFVQGENVVELLTPYDDGDEFANEVFGIGSGEGSKALRKSAAVRDGRLRRVAVVDAKDVTSGARLDALVRAELDARRDVLRVDQITVVDHPNAQFGTFWIGDDITVKGVVPFLGEVTGKFRITALEKIDADRMVLTLAPAA